MSTAKKKLRIAIWYDNRFGRNDGPPLYYLNAMQKMGLDVTHLIPSDDVAKFGKFDLHFWIDWGEDGLPVDHDWMPKDGGKTIYVCSDAHIDNKGKKYRFNRAKKFDYVFFNQPKAIEQYEKYCGIDFQPMGAWNKDVCWLPHAAEPQAYPRTEQLKKYDVCFIGHFQDTVNYNGFSRVDMLDFAFKKFPNFYFGTRSPQDTTKNMFEDAAKKFNQSKIVLNISITDDINMRFFEALATGSFLLTNKLPALKDLEKRYGFKDGVHYVSYKDLTDLEIKAKYFLSNEEERQRIADAGYEQAMKTGTYEQRIKEILKIISHK